MTKLSEAGEQEAVRLIESFKDKLKEAANLVIRDLYCDLLPHIESDAWLNFRNQLLDRLQDYPSLLNYDAEKVRKAILEKHRDAIIDGINADLLKENEQLKARIVELRSERY